ncbi:shikimate dehydrogenase [Buchnera aphidicola (Mindarus keteleerifoliae)]|uniref:shikimate dehydrogenase n=1 Tax=Buchnera aphidicola TaxID=9 RepID=UPI0031B7111F
MELDKFKHFSVFGNPIEHTLSPKIHSLFSKQTNIPCSYTAVKVPLNEFSNRINSFFNTIGDGANVTLPFKEEAYCFSDILTNRAKLTKSVNTLKKVKDEKILGDNTDGIGFLYDLNRLGFLKKNNKILLIGAGGAARGLLPSILSKNNEVFIYNRTYERAKKLAEEFRYLGKIQEVGYKDLSAIKAGLIIHATSYFFSKEKLILPSSLIHQNVSCYDLSYVKNSQTTPFLNWCKKLGAMNLANGIGMLISQAAYSFLLWNNILPDIEKIFAEL